MADDTYVPFEMGDDDVTRHVIDSLERHHEKVGGLRSGKAKLVGIRRVYVPACVWTAGTFSGAVDLRCMERTTREVDGESRTIERWYQGRRALSGAVDGVTVSVCRDFPTDRLLALAPFDLSRATDEPDDGTSDLDVDHDVDEGVARVRAEGVLRHTMEAAAVVDAACHYSKAFADGANGTFGLDGRPRLVWLPVITCSMECAGKSSEVIINGQTGEAVGRSPETYDASRRTIAAVAAIVCVAAIAIAMASGRGVTPRLVLGLAVVIGACAVMMRSRHVTGALADLPTCGHELGCLSAGKVTVTERTERRLLTPASDLAGMARSMGGSLAHDGDIPASEAWTLCDVRPADVIANPSRHRRELNGIVSYS